MPAAMQSFYLRKMYQENLLSKGQIRLLNTRIDLTKIRLPVFILSTREDHYRAVEIDLCRHPALSGPVTFCLSASGHIAGVVNSAGG